jgi:hypothetical protein
MIEKLIGINNSFSHESGKHNALSLNFGTYIALTVSYCGDIKTVVAPGPPIVNLLWAIGDRYEDRHL